MSLAETADSAARVMALIWARVMVEKMLGDGDGEGAGLGLGLEPWLSEMVTACQSPHQLPFQARTSRVSVPALAPVLSTTPLSDDTVIACPADDAETAPPLTSKLSSPLS